MKLTKPTLIEGQIIKEGTEVQIVEAVNVDPSKWCQSRETSYEIGEAILAMAKNEADANRIWENPTPSETSEVLKQAFNSSSEDELFWGTETVRR